MAGAMIVYSLITVNSTLYIVLIASGISGTGSSMFFPANNSAVMAIKAMHYQTGIIPSHPANTL